MLLPGGSSPLIPNGFVQISKNTITDFGSMETLQPPRDATVIEGEHHLLLPGLINGHNHSAMSLFRGLADDLELSSWLQDHIFPAEANHVSEEMVYWCTQLSAAEMILSGTTCVADGYFHTSSAAKAFIDAGLRAVVAHGLLDFPAPGVPDPADNITAVETFLQKWGGKHSLITPAVFAHSPYTCSPSTLKGAKQLADAHNVPFFIHLAESREEEKMIIEPQGGSPVKHLEALKLLDSNTICVHMIWLDDDDISILKKSGARVIVCPQSNCKLSSGIARVTDMLAQGITVGLGTDGCASNNSLDMFREMDMLAKLHKVAELDATALAARQTLNCATINNGLALGQPALGEIAIGNKADVILVRLRAPHLTPFYNQDLLVYAARGSDVSSVIIDGKIIMRDRKLLTFDVEETIKKVKYFAKKLKNTTD